MDSFFASIRSGCLCASPLVRDVSYNIRYDNPEDGIHSWTNREMHVSELLDFYRADIIGLQEALAHQYNDLQEVLTHYNSYGLGREDGLMDGEFCPIFWKRSRFDLEGKGTYGLMHQEKLEKKDGMLLQRALPHGSYFMTLIAKNKLS